jgi:hypothetical protein
LEPDVETVISCEPDQPLVERRDGVLDKETFEKVRDCTFRPTGRPAVRRAASLRRQAACR